MTSKYFIILEHNLSHFQFIVYMLQLTPLILSLFQTVPSTSVAVKGSVPYIMPTLERATSLQTTIARTSSTNVHFSATDVRNVGSIILNNGNAPAVEIVQTKFEDYKMYVHLVTDCQLFAVNTQPTAGKTIICSVMPLSIIFFQLLIFLCFLVSKYLNTIHWLVMLYVIHTNESQ